MSVAYLGVPGAFSHQACLAFLPEEEPVPQASFAAILDAVGSRATHLGILPVENSIAGPVEEVRDLLAAWRLPILSRHVLPVRMHLLGLPGSTLRSIHTAVSHPVALRQCIRTLCELGIDTEEATNTALAARDLRDPAKAVLASEAAATAYGLIILRHDVHDRKDNSTTFCIVAAERRLA